MNHADHVALIQAAIPEPGGVWADFGSGTGAFTLALAELTGPSATIYSIDKNRSALRQQEELFNTRYPESNVKFLAASFSRPLKLPPLDGAMMANSLHFFRKKGAVLNHILSYLKPGGRLILVEYNVDRGNFWVPHPVSFETWEAMAIEHGFIHTKHLAARPSRFLKEIFAAVSFKPG